VSKAIADEWRILSEEQRQKWVALAAEDRVRYDREMKDYRSVCRSLKVNPRKDPDAPKRPVSAFLAFSNGRKHAVKKKFPHMTNSDLSREMARQWRDAGPEFRRPYQEREEAQRALYKKKMLMYKLDQRKYGGKNDGPRDIFVANPEDKKSMLSCVVSTFMLTYSTQSHHQANSRTQLRHNAFNRQTLP